MAGARAPDVRWRGLQLCADRCAGSIRRHELHEPVPYAAANGRGRDVRRAAFSKRGLGPDAELHAADGLRAIQRRRQIDMDDRTAA